MGVRKEFSELMEQYNPFGFKYSNGKIAMFTNRTQLYLYTFERLYLAFPKGYIDMVVFVSEMTQMPYSECLDVVKTFKIYGVGDVIVVDDFWNDPIKCPATLVVILKCLHTITETEYDSGAFPFAYREFRERLNEDKIEGKVPKFTY